MPRKESDVVQTKPVILCVDDEQIILNNLRMELSEQFAMGFRIELADSGAYALELVDQLIDQGRKIAAVISDYRMPRIGGDELLQRLTAKLPHTAMIMLTGHADMDMLIKTVNKARLDGLLNKPWNREELVTMVRAAVNNFALKEELCHKTRILEQNEHLLHLAASAANLGTLQWDVQSDTVTYGDEWLEVFHYGQQTVANHMTGYLELVHKDDRQRVKTALETVEKNRKGSAMAELRLKDGRGDWRWVTLYALGIACGLQGDTQTILALNQDVTTGKNTEIQLAQALKKSQILDNLAERVIFMSPDLKVLWENHNTNEVFEFFCYKAWMGLDNPCDNCVALKALTTRKKCSGEMKTIQGRHYAKTAAPMIDEAGEVAGVIVTMQDITEHKLMEMELHHSRKMEAIGSLAAGIAHEINTPIQYIGDNLRFLGKVCETVREELSGKGTGRPALEGKVAGMLDMTPEAVSDALEGVAHVTKIVSAMKEFSHPGMDAMTRCDINRLIENAVTISRGEWKYVAEVETHFETPALELWSHVNDINQVLLNLIVNASHAIEERLKSGSQEKGLILLSSRIQDRQAIVSVSDNGAGIRPEIRDRIFDPFFTTKGVGKGTGQGLAMAYRIIVEKHKGRIEVDSQPGIGTVFTLSLPLAAAGVMV